MPSLTPSQQAFLTLHVKRIVIKWQWHFTGCTIQAWAGRRTASLGREELAGLEQDGLMEQGLGVSVSASEAGRAWVAEQEAAIGASMLKEKIK